MTGQDDFPFEDDIPSFAKPLAPYIKTRQETLQIRRALTLYLRSHIDFSENDSSNPCRHDQSHLSLCAPHDAVVDVKRIPPELTCLRKEYLSALQENAAAKRNYRSLVENVTTAKVQRQTPSSGTSSVADDAGSGLETYFTLLRDRRRHAKLQVFRHCLQELSTRNAARPEYFELQEGRNQQVPSPDEFEGEAQSFRGADGGIEGLVHKLEKAVVRAKSQLDREKKLFEELKGQRGSGDRLTGQDLSPATKAKALQRTRDELVQWVEEKLVMVSGNDDSPVREVPPEEIEESTRLLQERKEQIREQYAAYVEARKDLLDAISGACQPVTAASTMPQPRIASKDKNVTESTGPALDPLNVLSFATEILLPLSKTQKALALQRSYLTGLLAKEKFTTLRTLNRLRDESHLLPEYPILARQPRFKHAVAAINSRSAADHPNQQNNNNKPDEIASLAEAWAFASKAARENEKEFVEQKAMMGAEIVRDEQRMLEELYSMLNQDFDEVVRGDIGGSGVRQETRDEGITDIWTYEARSTGLRGRQTRAKGPWSGLNGRIGVHD